MYITMLPALVRGIMENPSFKGLAVFSNGELYTNRPHQFGKVYVFNDDYLHPGSHLGMHPHANVEIVTIMISGTESHKDSLGAHENYGPGDVQLISSGAGIWHEGGNVSHVEPSRHLQIWITPKIENTMPAVQVKKYMTDALVGYELLAAP